MRDETTSSQRFKEEWIKNIPLVPAAPRNPWMPLLFIHGISGSTLSSISRERTSPHTSGDPVTVGKLEEEEEGAPRSIQIPPSVQNPPEGHNTSSEVTFHRRRQEEEEEEEDCRDNAKCYMLTLQKVSFSSEILKLLIKTNWFDPNSETRPLFFLN